MSSSRMGKAKATAILPLPIVINTTEGGKELLGVEGEGGMKGGERSKRK